jgi:glycosyltransferase involved in cell wall biosynthesis
MVNRRKFSEGMKLSIITVCYNSAATIENTFKSVKEQTYDNIEYIIVDGNSNDTTVEIIKNYEAIISKWISEPDLGLYDAMNKGIGMATGDLVGILNSDDVFYNNSVLTEIARFHTINSIDASLGNIVQCDDTGKVLRRYFSKNWMPSKLKMGFMPPHPSIFFKRSLFEKYGVYNLDYRIAADYDLIVRFFLRWQISWSYSGVTTTNMLAGGLSSSGFKSYQLISKEVVASLSSHQLKFSPLAIRLRILWKVFDLVKK